MREVERLLSLRGAIDRSTSVALARASKLRTGVLSWALQGKLVDQDSVDEPASFLLEHIKAERPPAADWHPRPGVKANVLFFDRKPGAEKPWTETVWVYDLRSNKHFRLKTNRMTRADLDEFAACCQPGARHRRTPTRCAAEPEGRWRRFSYEEIVARDKVSLDLFWLRDESLEDSANLPSQGARAGDRGRPAGGAGADRGRSGRFGG